MIFTETKLAGAYLIEVEPLEDHRGFFGRYWCQNEMAAHGLKHVIRQANLSLSLKAGTIRGMHYQVAPYQESKCVSCAKGRVYDVIIDLRPESETFMQWEGYELREGDNKMIYVPDDFAHGILSLEDNSQLLYLVSEFYTPSAERGIRYNDPVFNIQWPIEIQEISDKDRMQADFDLQSFDQ